MFKIQNLKNRKQALINRISACEKERKEIVDLVQKLLSQLKIGEISKETYEKKLNLYLENRTPEEWLDYYNDYILTVKLHLEFCEKEIKKEKLKSTTKITSFLIIGLLALIIVIYLLKPIILTSPSQEYTNNINLVFDKTQDFTLQLENKGQLKNLKISGEIEGQGDVKIYLEDILLLDSSNLEEIILTSPEIAESPATKKSPTDSQAIIVSPTPAPSSEMTKTIKKFSNFCEEICNLEQFNLNKGSYKLRIEISNAKLNLNSITYELKKEEEQLTLPLQTPSPTPTQTPTLKPTQTPIPEITPAPTASPIETPTPTHSPIKEKVAIIQETETKNSKIITGQPVKWLKKIKVGDEKEVRIEIPKEAVNIDVKKGYQEIKAAEDELSNYEDSINNLDKKDFARGNIPLLEIKKEKEEYQASEIEDKKILDLTQIVSKTTEKEFAITYFTQGPVITEKETKNGKRIIISGSNYLENILAFTTIDNEAPIEAIHLYHIEGENKIEIPIIKYGGYIEWTVPHLSNQTYELEINILTLQSYPAVGGIWRVEFNTTGKANLTIKASNGTTWSNENENNDLKFLEIKCGSTALNYEWINDSVFLKDFECNQSGFEISKAITPGKHNLEFNFGGIKKYAYNLAGQNRVKGIIKGSGVTSGTTTDVTISPAISDISKAIHFVSYRHTFANDHADTFKSSEIINPSTLRIFGDSTGGNNAVSFEYTIIEFDSVSPIKVQRSTATHSPSSTFPRLTSFTPVTSLSQAFLINEGHSHNGADNAIGCEEYDRVRLISTSAWELNIGCAPNTGPQQNRIEIVDWNDPISLKSVQRGIATLTSLQTALTITPPILVDPTHTLLSITARVTSGQTWNADQIGLFATLNSAGNIIIERQSQSPGSASIELAWELVEFNPSFANVQHVTISSITGATAAAPISSVDQNNAIAIGTVFVPFGHGSGRNTATTAGGINANQFTITIPNPITVQVQRGTATGTAKVGLQVLSFTNYAPVISDISNIPDQIVTESGTTNVQFFVIAKDENGVRDLNDATITAQFTKSLVTRTGSCSFDSDIDSTTRRYSCTIGIRYYDNPGTWTVSAAIQDSKSLSSLPYSETFNLLETTCISISPSAMTWPIIFPGDIDKLSSNNPILISNTCNKAGSIKIKAFDLLGETSPSLTIPANKFSIHTAGYCQPIDTGTLMSHNVDMPITGASLPIGDNSLGQGQVSLYFCIEDVPEDLIAQTYSTPAGSQWVISVLAALIIPRVKKKKKRGITEDNIMEILENKLKEKYNIDLEELLSKIKKKDENKTKQIPISIFKQEIGAAESLCKYLKENESLTFKEISSILNRDQRTIWINYNNARKKKKEKFEIKEKDLVPIEIFSDRKLSILEALVYYLKQKGLKNIEVSKMLSRDPRNIHTLNSRAMKKLNVRAQN